MTVQPNLSLLAAQKKVLGHGDFKYSLDPNWGNLDPAKVPVVNCHEMVMDRKGRMILLTDEPKNNVIIYDQSGKLLTTWTLGLPSGLEVGAWIPFTSAKAAPVKFLGVSP